MRYLAWTDTHAVQSLERPEMRPSLYVKCPQFLSCFNQNWNVYSNVNKTPQGQI